MLAGYVLPAWLHYGFGGKPAKPLVFAGIYAIGNPVDILINPQADQAEIARATAAWSV